MRAHLRTETDEETGDGVGDFTDSWAVDGSRQQTFHPAEQNEWPIAWAGGDVIGFAADMDSGTLLFSKERRVAARIAFLHAVRSDTSQRHIPQQSICEHMPSAP